MKRIVLILLVCFAASLTIQAQSTKVLLKTTMGDMTLMLYDDTPIHKDNFIELVNKKFYDGIIFHRVIPEFMDQVGDARYRDKLVESAYKGDPVKYTIPAEIRPNHFHKKGALSAARLGDKVNPRKASSGSQFYIVTGRIYTEAELAGFVNRGRLPFTEEEKKAYTEIGGTPHLDHDYTVFGEVLEGIDVAVKIGLVNRNPRTNKPLNDVKIISARIIK